MYVASVVESVGATHCRRFHQIILLHSIAYCVAPFAPSGILITARPALLHAARTAGCVQAPATPLYAPFGLHVPRSFVVAVVVVVASVSVCLFVGLCCVCLLCSNALVVCLVCRCVCLGDCWFLCLTCAV